MKLLLIHDTDKPELMGLSEAVTLNLPFSGLTTIEASIEKPYWWDGNSTPPTPIARWIVPKWFYILASAFHDYLCGKAKTKEERSNADKDYRYILKLYYKQKIRAGLGYLGVRIGAFFGIGNNF